MPPKFNNARESAAPYNRAARRSAARSAPTTDAIAPTSSSSLLKTPSPLRAAVSPPSTPPSPSGPSRKRRHDDDDEEQQSEVVATSRVDSSSASSSLVTPPLPKKRRSDEPDSSIVVAAAEVEEQVAPSSPSSSSLPTPSQGDAAPAPRADSPSPASPSAASSSSPSPSSPSSPSLVASPAHSLASTAPSSPPRTTEPSSPAPSSKSLSDHSTSTSDLPPSVAPAHTEVATSPSAGPTSRVDIAVQTDAATGLADDSRAIVALRGSLEEATAKIVELEQERDENQKTNAKLSADLVASQTTAELHRKNSEDLVSQGDSMFVHLQNELSERSVERDSARTRITELKAALEQLQAQVRAVEAGRLQDREYAEKSMQQLVDSHAQRVEKITQEYRAKQLEDNEKTEKAIKEQAEAQTRDLAAIITAQRTKELEDRTTAEKALKELTDAHAQELAAIAGKHQADVEEAKAYFATMTSQREQLEREKERAESAFERNRQTSSRMKQVLHGLADAVKALDPPLPCTICASLLNNLHSFGSECHIPSASCAVQPVDRPRIHIPDNPRDMRIVEIQSENDDESSDEGSDDDDDDDGMESEDEDESAGAKTGPTIINCRPEEDSDDDDLPVHKRYMMDARRVPNYENLFRPDRVEEVLDAFPFLKENPGVWFRTIPHVLYSYDEGKDELRIMARPPLNMFESE